MSASVAFKHVQSMLKDCARGYHLRRATRSRVVTYRGRVYRTLPKYDNIELGHVRKMVRHLEIDRRCVRKYVQV